MSSGWRWLSRTLVVLTVAAVTWVGVPALAQEAPDGTAGAPPAPAGVDRAAVRAELSLARRLARLDEDLGLETFPDATPLWLNRLSASIASRGEHAPAQALLDHLAFELQGLGVDWTLGGPPDGRPEGRPAASSPAGRQRAERIRRIGDLLDLIERKLGLAGAGEATEGPLRAQASTASMEAPASRITPRSGSDSCASAISLSLGDVDGSTVNGTIDGSASCGGPTPTPDLWFVFTPPATAAYTFETVESFSSTFDTVLSLHSACPDPGGSTHEIACSDDAGPSLLSSISRTLTKDEPVWVRVSGYDGATGSFRLHVSVARTIRGTVTTEGTGAPVEGAMVSIVDWSGWPYGQATTAADGSYAAAVTTSTDQLYARTTHPSFVTELYSEIDCPFGTSCFPANGTLLPADVNDVRGIDFTLAPGGTITGTVLAADTGQPLASGNYLFVYDTDGILSQSVAIDPTDGTYEIRSLAPESYYMWTGGIVYQYQAWEDVECPYPCDPRVSGTPIPVVGGERIEGIDFVLDRFPNVRGTVTVEGSGDPVAFDQVHLYDDNGAFVTSRYTSGSGLYEFYRVPGTYYVRTATTDYINEVYDDVLCEPSCAVSTGDPVGLTYNTTVEGIDFALSPKASISGTVTDSETHDPAPARVFLHDAAGAMVASTFVPSYSTDGAYLFRGLAAGTYYLRTGYGDFDGYNSHEGELYDDLPCRTTCDVTAGTPVVTSASSQVNGIDFALDHRGWITGTVRSTTGEPIRVVFVWAFDTSGNVAVGPVLTSTDGTYRLDWLTAGRYRVGVSHSQYLDEMYDDLPCPEPCDPTMGALVTVRPKLETSGIDFALRRYGSLSGTVYDGASGQALFANVYLLDPSGTVVASDFAFPGFSFPGVVPGSYYLLARYNDGASAYQDELYPDVPCEPDCDLADGTPIPVALESDLTGLDFFLAPCPGESRAEVVGETIPGYLKVFACDEVRASDTLLTSGADLLIRSGRTVVLGDGFRMDDGARLQIIIEPAWGEN